MNERDSEMLSEMLDVRLGAQPTGKPHLSSITVKMSADAIDAIDRFVGGSTAGRSGYVRKAINAQLKRDIEYAESHPESSDDPYPNITATLKAKEQERAVRKDGSYPQPPLGFEDGAAESRSKPPF